MRWLLLFAVMLLTACGSVTPPGPGPGPDPDPDPGPPPPGPVRLMTVAEARALGVEAWPELSEWGEAWDEIGTSVSEAGCHQRNGFKAKEPAFLREYFPMTMAIAFDYCDDIVPSFESVGPAAVPVTHIPRQDRVPLNGFTPIYWIWSDDLLKRGPQLPSGSLVRHPTRVEFLPYRPNEFEYRVLDPAGRVQWLRGEWLETTQLDLREGDGWVKVPGFTHAQFSAFWVDRPVLELDMRQEWMTNRCGESQAVGWSSDNFQVMWRAPGMEYPSEMRISNAWVRFMGDGWMGSASATFTAGSLSASAAASMSVTGGFDDEDENCVRSRSLGELASFTIFLDVDSLDLVRIRGLAGIVPKNRTKLHSVRIRDAEVRVGNLYFKLAGTFKSGTSAQPHEYLDSFTLTFADGSMTLREFLISIGVMRAASFLGLNN